MPFDEARGDGIGGGCDGREDGKGGPARPELGRQGGALTVALRPPPDGCPTALVAETRAARLTLELAGPVTLAADGGADLLPPSRKIRALLALLGTAPDLCRSRTELRAKLWQRAGPEAGGASLRQALHRLRHCLGPHREALRLERGLVGLDPELVVVRLPSASPGAGNDMEFAADADVTEPAFQRWLCGRRAAVRCSDPEGRPTVALEASGSGSEVALAVLAEATQRLADQRPLTVLAPGGGRIHEADLILSCRQIGADRSIRLSVMLRDMAAETVLWARGFDAATTCFDSMVDSIAAALVGSVR